jgi:hypothetical protein
MRGRVYPPLAERFAAKVDKSPGHGPAGDCWSWTGAVTDRGYGVIVSRGARLRAHRVAYELAHGPIVQSGGYHWTCVLHRCDNPQCVNPSHLFTGTPKDNWHDMAGKGRNPSHKGEHNEAVKLSESDVRAIRESKETHAAASRRYGVHETTILRIRCRILWRHL